MTTRHRVLIAGSIGVLTIAILAFMFHHWGAGSNSPMNTGHAALQQDKKPPANSNAVEPPKARYNNGDFSLSSSIKPSDDNRYVLSRTALQLTSDDRGKHVLDLLRKAYPDMPQTVAETVATVFTNELTRQLPHLSQSEELLLLKSIDVALYPQLKSLPLSRSSAHLEWSIDRLELVASKWGVVFSEMMRERPPDNAGASLDEVVAIAREHYARICNNPAGLAPLERFATDSKASADCYFSPDGKYGFTENTREQLKRDLEAVFEQSKRNIADRLMTLETNKDSTAEEKEKQKLFIMTSEAVNVFPVIRTAAARSTPADFWERVQVQLSKQDYQKKIADLFQRKLQIDKAFMSTVRKTWAREAQRTDILSDMRHTFEEQTEETLRNLK